MSQSYSITLRVRGYDKNRIEQIKRVASEEWAFEQWEESDWECMLESQGDDHLCLGVSEEDLVDRFSKAIWNANGDHCDIEVYAVCLEDLPCEYHSRDKSDYDRLTGEYKSHV